MSKYGAYSDDFYVNLNLNTEMELSNSRENVLHFFEQLRKRYPTMRNFYTPQRGEHVLEEDKERGRYRWASAEPRRITSGSFNPDSLEEAIAQHKFVLDLAPYSLAVSPLDCESLNVMFGFDFTYRGNHNQLVAEALGVIPAFERFAEAEGNSLVAYEPAVQFAVDDECRIQCRLSIETRTSAYHIRTAEFPEEQFSVYFTARRYGALEAQETYEAAFERLVSLCREAIDGYVINNVLRPLQEAIAIK